MFNLIQFIGIALVLGGLWLYLIAGSMVVSSIFVALGIVFILVASVFKALPAVL